MPRQRQTLYALTDALIFPSPELARPDGLLAAYGDLSTERLLLAYQSGIFPWYSDDSPILWWSPPQRAILAPGEVHVGRSLRKVVRRGTYEIRWDTDFPSVIRACATVPRGDGLGTWLVPEMQDAYLRLHRSGYAHSVESYLEGQLVGGLYGVSLGGAFFGESMFSVAPDASKVAFVALCERLQGWGFDLIDCQIMNPHLQRFGAYLIPRREFLARLRASLQRPTRRGPWTCENAHPGP
jgi:leucyl/phenylalanyl-tRNA--protein transferase